MAEHEGFLLAEAIQTKLVQCGFESCIAELTFADHKDIIEDTSDGSVSVSISPEEVQGLGMFCRDAKNMDVVVHVQICRAARGCSKPEKLEELRSYLCQVKDIRKCICEMGNCDFPDGICPVEPVQFQELPTDEDLSNLCIMFREIQFSFGVAVKL